MASRSVASRGSAKPWVCWAPSSRSSPDLNPADGEKGFWILASVVPGCWLDAESFERCVLQPKTHGNDPCSASPPAALHCCYDLSHPNFLHLPCPRGRQFLEPFIRAQERNCHLLSLLQSTGCYHKPRVNPLNENKNIKRCMFMSSKNSNPKQQWTRMTLMFR